jgi:hypothetical protein
VLEPAAGKKPIIRLPPGNNPPGKRFVVKISSVSDITMRGIRLESEQDNCELIFITGHNAGLVLNQMELSQPSSLGIGIFNLQLSNDDKPVVIENCTFDGGGVGLGIVGWGQEVHIPAPSSNVVIRNNNFLACQFGMMLNGAPRRILIAGNRMQDCVQSAVDLRDFLVGSGDVLVANNTMHHNGRALRIFDDSMRGNPGMTDKKVRFQNNLVLHPLQSVDLFCADHRYGVFDASVKGGDASKLLNAWTFSHNWREIVPPPPGDANAPFWIPGPRDELLNPINNPIKVMSTKPGDPNFLRPPKDSPLANAGAGTRAAAAPMGETMENGDLPAYVGAMPPEGVEPWNWDKTWKKLASKTILPKPE